MELKHKELRFIGRTISRRMDRAFNFAALFDLAAWGLMGALCGINHGHSADAKSLPAAAEVVTRNLGASCDSTVMTDPDMAGCEANHDGDSFDHNSFDHNSFDRDSKRSTPSSCPTLCLHIKCHPCSCGTTDSAYRGHRCTLIIANNSGRIINVMTQTI